MTDARLRRKEREGTLTSRDLARTGAVQHDAHVKASRAPGSAQERERTRQARINRLIEYIFDDRSNAFCDWDYVEGIAGETDEPTILGNFNNPTRYHKISGPAQEGKYFNRSYREETDDRPARLENIFTQLGVDCAWSDEYLRCACGKAFRVQPDGFNWEMYGWIGDGDYMCGDCLAETECDACGMPDIQSSTHCHQKEDNVCHCACCPDDEGSGSHGTQDEAEGSQVATIRPAWLG